MTQIRHCLTAVLILLVAGLTGGYADAQQPGEEPGEQPADEASAEATQAPPGGAPPGGNGAIDYTGFVRVWDGDTIEVRVNGNRVLVGLIGVDAPMGNTPCGRDASAQLWALVRGGVRLEEDPTQVFDARGRRMYYGFARDGRSLALELTRAGVARAQGAGRETAALAQAENDARAARRGCVWGGPLTAAAPQPSAAAAAASTLPSGFAEDAIVTGLTNPTNFTLLPDGRILIAEQSGLVRLYKNGALLSTPFLDLRGRVNDYGDRGLVGMAVHPSFPTNGFVYLYYTYENDAAQWDGSKTGRLGRFTASGDTASLGSELVLLGSAVGSSCNDFPVGADCLAADAFHVGGNIKFGADGNLYLTTGDGANFNFVDDNALRVQNLDLLAGKLLRITPNGAGLSDNPYWNGNANANRSKVWAYGLRNPFRFDVRPGGLPYIGDVGWNTWEEIDVGVRGANFGWPCYEGHARQSGYEPKAVCQELYGRGASAWRGPLHAYNHDGGGASVTGGAFYTGSSFPVEYQGVYFYGDYVRGFVNYLKVDGNNNLIGSFGFATVPGGPVAFEVGADGHLYYLAIGAGELRRVRATGQQVPAPTAPAYLSDLQWTRASNGWGPAERDMSNGDSLAGDGSPIRLAGVTYAKGLGVHAAADVRFNLGGNCTNFTARVGVDDAVGRNGSVVFQVLADGLKRYDSGVMSGNTPTKSINLNMTGVRELGLIVTNGGDNINYDHADWADARVTCGGSADTTPPTVSGVSPASGATGVPVTTTVTATFTEAMDPATLTTATVTLVKQGTTTPVAATVVYDSAAWRVTLTPSASLEAGASYTATVKGGAAGAKDLAGNALATDRVWSFTTAAPNTAPAATISQPASSLTFKVGDTITYSGSATDAEDGTIPATGLNWEIRLQHCPGGSCHVHPITMTVGSGGSFTVQDHGDDIYYEIVLIATDSGGLEDMESVAIQPQTARVTLATSPPGLQVVYNGEAGTAPLTRTAVVGGTRTIHAPSPQGNQVFVSWSDGGAQQHNIAVGAADATYTATFMTATDTTPPLISALTDSGITASTATITWTTNEPADTQVEYGTTASYGMTTTLNPALVTSHSQQLTGLQRNTLYHYRVRSRDAAGNLSTATGTFRTRPN